MAAKQSDEFVPGYFSIPGGFSPSTKKRRKTNSTNETEKQ